MMANFIVHGDFKHAAIEMNADRELHPNLRAPLSSVKSGGLIIITGASGSGKSNMLFRLFDQAPDIKTGKKQDLLTCFHDIMIVSPSMKTLGKKKHKLNLVPENCRFKTLIEFLDGHENVLSEANQLDEEREEDEEIPEYDNLVILDDIGNEIRTPANLNRFKQFIDNRRHDPAFTIILLLQSMMQIPPALRGSINLLIAYKPKEINEMEKIFELTCLPRKAMTKFFETVYSSKFDSLAVDLTLKDSSNYLFYKNLFNPIEVIKTT